MTPIRLLLVHGHHLMAAAMSRAFDQRTEVELVGIAEDCDQAATLAAGNGVDMALVDAGLERNRALDWISRMRRQRPSFKIIPMGLPNEESALVYLEAGACGYVLEETSLAELVATVVAVFGDQPPCSERMVAYVCTRIAELAHVGPVTPEAGGATLTPRESEVLGLVASGMRNKEIAHELSISLPTVKNHVHSILEKLQARGRREAILRAYEQGLLHRPAFGGSRKG